MGQSVDCPNVINLAKGLLMPSKQPTRMTQIETDCCAAATGVTCLSLRVTAIVWRNLNLAGVVNGSALPSTLTRLDLFNNKIGGGFPSPIPSALREIDFYINLMSGQIPPIPLNMNWLDLGSNLFTGYLPPINDGMTFFNLWNNQVSGGINYIPSSLTGQINIGANKMNGTIPIIPNTITDFYCGANSFVGRISIYRPSRFEINNNLFTSVSITDISFITSCILSYNQIYSDTVALYSSKCAILGLLIRPTISISSFSSSKLLVTSNGLPTTSTLRNINFQTTKVIASSFPHLSSSSSVAFYAFTPTTSISTQLDDLDPQSSMSTDPTFEPSTTSRITDPTIRSSDHLDSTRTVFKIFSPITTISPFVNTFPSKGITVALTVKSFLKCLVELTVLIIVLMKTPRHKKAKNRFTTRQTEDFA